MRAGHQATLKKYRMHFIIASLQDPAFSKELSPDGRQFEILSSNNIKVMSENRVFEELGMTRFNDVDLFTLFHNHGR